MHLKGLRYILCIPILVVCSILTVSAQDFLSSTMWLKINDDVGGHDSLVYGIHRYATYNVDAALGENSSPPDPPGFFSKFVSIPSRNNTWGFGLIKKDLRDSVSAIKKDTFAIYVTNNDSVAMLPGVLVVFRWPDAGYLGQRCDSMYLEYTTFVTDTNTGNPIFTKHRVNMFSQDNVVLTRLYYPNGDSGNYTAPIANLRIYKYGTHFPYVDAVHQDKHEIPAAFALHQNYPNPFNPTTTMRFEIQKQAITDISVYNILGQKVATLVSQEMAPGTYTVVWQGRNDQGTAAPSGVYFVRMTARGTRIQVHDENFVSVRKLVLMK